MEASGQAPADGAKLNFGEKVVVMSGGVLAGLALAGMNPVMPSIERDLAHSDFDAMLVKQMLGVVSLAMVIGAPLGGFLIDRLGMRRILLAATLVYAIAGTAGFYLASLPMLLVSRLVLGAAAASIQIMSITLINTKLGGNDRAKWMGLHVSIATISMMLIMPLSGALGEIGWHWPFLLYAVGLVLFAAVLFDRGSGTARVAHAPGSAGPAGKHGPGIISWFPWHYLLLAILIGAVTFLPAIYIPFQLREQAGLTPSGIALVLTGTSVLGALSSMFYGPARRLLSSHAAFACSFGLAGAGALVTAHAASLPVMLGGLVIYSLGISWFVPNIMTALGAKVTADQQGRAAGLVKAAHFLSAPLCVVLVEPYARQYGAATVMLVVAVIGSVMFAVSLLRMAMLAKAKPAPAE